MIFGQGTVGKWLVKEGDCVSPGDSFAEIETDKASMAFECQDDLYIAKILVSEAKEVPVGDAIMVTVENEADVASFESFTVADLAIGAITKSVEEPVDVEVAPVGQAPATRRVRLSPAAAHMANSRKISFENVVGTSRGGRISKSDLILAIKTGVAVTSLFLGKDQEDNLYRNFGKRKGQRMAKCTTSITETKQRLGSGLDEFAGGGHTAKFI